MCQWGGNDRFEFCAGDEQQAAAEAVLGVAVRAVLADASPPADEAAFVFALGEPGARHPG